MEWGDNNSASLKCMSEAEELHLQLKGNVHPFYLVSPCSYPFGKTFGPRNGNGPIIVRIYVCSPYYLAIAKWARLTCFPICFSIIHDGN